MEEDFSHYSDPQKARNIWLQYVDDIRSIGGMAEARVALSETSDPDELDVRLDQIETGIRILKRGCSSDPVGPDEDSGGYRSNARKFLED